MTTTAPLGGLGRALLLGLMVVVPLLPAVATASPEPGTPADARVDDNGGDVKIVSNGQSVAAPSPYFDHVDIEAAWIGGETDSEVQVGVQFKAMDPAVSLPVYRRYFTLNFVRGEPESPEAVQYRVANLGRGCQDGAGSLQYFDVGRNEYRSLKCVPVEVDAGTATYTYTLAKDDVVDAKHAPMRYGDTLTSFSATATNFIAGGGQGFGFLPVPVGGASATDRAPDSDFGPVFTGVLGVTGAGHLHLDSAEPVRVSNGEGTTIVFQGLLHNSGAETDEAFLAVEDNGGEGWEIRVPPTLTVEAGQALEFPIILTMPFTHVHGQTWTFTVKATSSVDPEAWSMHEFGVFFTDVPQPSQHHGGLLYLHSADAEGDDSFSSAFTTVWDFKRTWMNPEDEDPEADATDEPVPAYFNEGLFGAGGGNIQHIARWEFPLSPGLLIGLDFDVDQAAPFTTRIHNTVPADSATLDVDLLYCDPTVEGGGGGGGFGQGAPCPGEWKVIAGGTSEPKSFGPNGDTVFEVPLAVDPDADLIPYHKDANLRLRVILTTNLPQNTVLPEPKPVLYPDDSLLTLPLLEYHDPVEQSFLKVGTLQLALEGPVEKRVNPGRASLFTLTLTNAGLDAQSIALEAVGTNKEWARYPGGLSLTVSGAESRSIQLLVEAPEGSVPDMRADLFVVAQSADDPNVAAVARVRAIVVDPAVEDIPDESGDVEAAAGGESPGFEVLAVAAALGMVLRRGRRGRAAE